MKLLGLLSLVAAIFGSSHSSAGTAQCSVLYYVGQNSNYHLDPAFTFEFDSLSGVYAVTLHQTPTARLLASVTELKGKLRLSIEKDFRPLRRASVIVTGEFANIGNGPIYFDQNEDDGENIHISCVRIK